MAYQSDPTLSVRLSHLSSSKRYYSTLRTKLTIEMADLLLLRRYINGDLTLNDFGRDDPETPDVDEREVAEEDFYERIEEKFDQSIEDIEIQEVQDQLRELIRVKLSFIEPTIDDIQRQIYQLRGLQVTDTEL